MVLKYIYIAFIMLSAAAAIILFHNSAANKSSGPVRFRRNIKSTISKLFHSLLYNEELDKVFLSSGLQINSVTYNLIRYTIFMVWLIIIIISYVLYGYVQSFQVFIFLALLFVTRPAMTFMGRKTPFAFIINILSMEYKHKKNQEIYRAMSQLKNLSIISANTRIGSDFIIQELMKMTKITKPIFATMLRFWRENERQAAIDYFTSAVDTREGAELANIFSKLDDLGPDELLEQISLAQNIFIEERRTNKEKRNENRGYALYAFVIITICIILLNFIVLILYENTLEVFKNISFSNF